LFEGLHKGGEGGRSSWRGEKENVSEGKKNPTPAAYTQEKGIANLYYLSGGKKKERRALPARRPAVCLSATPRERKGEREGQIIVAAAGKKGGGKGMGCEERETNEESLGPRSSIHEKKGEGGGGVYP